jgi:serine/threonine protein kinase
MTKLAWLAFSGNPFCIQPVLKPLTAIDWSQLRIDRVLGEGASGIIFKAHHRFEDQQHEIAIKIFKGAVTSDGLPEDEMNACIAAGNHLGLVTLLGQINGHPENKKGLVMALIPPHYYNLGLPPSFESCTRDVFRADMRLTARQVLKIAGTMASVARHLHERGIMHSDLYAHNMLIDAEGNTLFGDFGAACFYEKADEPLAAHLERMEVRAYGYLLDDLLGICPEAQTNRALLTLGTLRDACLADEILVRPSFQQIAAELNRLI